MSNLNKYAFSPAVTATLVDPETTRNTLRLEGPCPHCKKTQTVFAAAESVIKFGEGGAVQKCFPTLTAGQREFLLSGTCDDCWTKMFPEVDDVCDG
jgi:ribosomal protein S27E